MRAATKSIYYCYYLYFILIELFRDIDDDFEVWSLIWWSRIIIFWLIFFEVVGVIMQKEKLFKIERKKKETKKLKIKINKC